MPTNCLKHPLIGNADFTMQGCTITYDNNSAQVHDRDGHLVLIANKGDLDRLWLMDLGQLTPMAQPSTDTEDVSASVAVRFRTLQEKVNYLHLVCRSKPPTSIARALRKEYIRSEEGWPCQGITAGIFKRDAKQLPATAIGHLKQHRQGYRSTKPHLALLSEDCDDDNTTVSDLDSINSGESELPDDFDDDTQLDDMDPSVAYIKLFDNGSHADAKGPYRTIGVDGERYDFLVIFGNFAWVKAIQGTSGADQLKALEEYQQYVKDNCANPPSSYQRLDQAGDNPQVRAHLEKNNQKLQLCMANVHRSLKAERAHQDWQALRLSSAARHGDGFPRHYWSKLHYADIVIFNHMRPHSSNDQISAWHGFHGKRFNYSHQPILPAACKISRLDRARFKDGNKSTTAYILGPDLKRHRVQRILVRDKGGN